jgi:oligosaccharide repeat unit polymerase
MKIKVHRSIKFKPLILVLCLLELIAIVIFINLDLSYSKSNFDSYCLFSVFFCPLQIALLIIGGNISIISFPCIYLFITYLFSNSAFILYLFNGSDGLQSFRIVDYDYLARTIPLVCLAFVSFSCGALIHNSNRSKREKLYSIYKKYKHNNYHKIILLFLSLFIMTISLVIIIVGSLQGKAIALMVSEGYTSFAQVEKKDILTILIAASFSWLLPWSTIIIVAISSQSAFYLRRSFLLVFLTSGLLIITGDRGGALPILLIYVQVYSITIPDFDLRKWLIFLLFAFFLIPLLQVLRAFPIVEWNINTIINIANNFDDYFSNFSYALLGPFSSVIETFMGTLMQIKSWNDYRFGFDYVRSFLASIPFNSSIAPSNGEWVREYLSPGSPVGTGFMTMAEAYLNFSWLGIIFIYSSLGFLMAKYWKIFIKNKFNVVELSLVLLLFYATLISVRNEATIVFRTLIWGYSYIYFLPIFIKYFIIRRSAKKKFSDTNEFNHQQHFF